MKCGNEKCDYELYLEEVDFVLCPKCGELIRHNLQPEYFKKIFLTGQTERFRNATLWRERFERGLRLSPIVLWAISQLAVFGLGGDVLIEMVDFANGIPQIQFVRESQMVFGLAALCFVINKAYDYLRIGFMGGWWHSRLWPHLLIKAVIYVVMVVVVSTNQIPDFYTYLDQAQKASEFAEPVLQGALTNARIWFTGLVWWSLTANYLADAIDTFNEQRVYLMNKIIMMKPIE